MSIQRRGDCTRCGRQDITVFDGSDGSSHCRKCCTEITSVKLTPGDAARARQIRREYARSRELRGS